LRWTAESIHSVEVTPANIHDSHVLPWLLHADERRAWGDSAYAGQAAVLSVCAPHARDFTHRPTATLERRATNRWKSRIRARVEHPIGVIKTRLRLHQGVLSRLGEKPA